MADSTYAWLAEQHVLAADAVVLLPFADLLAPGRRALARPGQWLPRVHTPRTLAAALGPPQRRAAGELTGDSAIDRIAARTLLRGQTWAGAWQRRDARAFDAALDRLVRTAHTLRQWATSMPPAQRAAWWAHARQCTAAGRGPGATQRLLLQLALEWAALGDSADTDRLFAHRPAAWVALTLGGEDALTTEVLRHGAAQGVPALMLSADPGSADPFDAWHEQCQFEIELADDAEAEAIAAAMQVSDRVHAGATPVALVAQDRAVVRRVRALLERLQIDVVDETGWSLATTRAGAHAAAALRAARAHGPGDDVLDWLKADLGDGEADALATLEKLWRGQRVPDGLRARAESLWQRERERLDAFAHPRRRTVAQWLQALDRLLFGSLHGAGWRDDAAGVQLRHALRLGEAGQAGAAWAAAAASPCSLDEFSAWVDATLEEASFVPPPAERAAAVVITPLARAIGREFAVAVVPGADELRLGPLPPDTGLLDEPWRKALGLPERAARQRRAELAFLQLLRLPHVVALRRAADGDELLSVSPWIERLRLARHRRGASQPVERKVQLPHAEVAAAPSWRPGPRAADALPASFSASWVEALRQCPYRFFSRAVLQLSEPDELDDDADKRDAGRWLHTTLERFHRARDSRRSAPDDVAQLIATGEQALLDLEREQRVSAQAMLPFSAGWPALAGRYVRWLHEQEAQGWSFQAAEIRVDATPVEPQGLQLHGRIDRIDTSSDGSTVRLIDYKTNSRQSLQAKVRQPLEDTQLAVYAALHLAHQHEQRAVQACYLALDDPRDVIEVPHKDVEDSARRLVQEVARERLRMRLGEPLPALGEPPVCDTCEAKGLCRRGHWADDLHEAADAR